jgi:antitoxin (DNA-binding transcriptional repressor) of toxin-antitoxin stability system
MATKTSSDTRMRIARQPLCSEFRSNQAGLVALNLPAIERSEEVIIPRHDKSAARAVPEAAQRLDDVRRAVAGLRDLQQRIRLRTSAKLSNQEVRQAIDEGRL